ncbi:hypothetical protein A3A66_02820 [Microgenomates group bacterium RIFCSPLOWO2_01_FULL_46_13]|nr:MAG: hypothetical protein A2783_00085 [Microgenomates group bacterium RIFCSPHIGHO2_01_FULL_45_11]OGV94900.1 MAG: hypothetical protein A3A66_02820 [Microgenomates group bacterium RIFCSPLOWO2_01_FULL_46_13]
MKVFLTKKAEKELDKLPDTLARMLVNNLKDLALNPFPPNSKKLTGQNNYRLRVGSYRAIYGVDRARKEVTVLRVAHRRTIYR